MDDIGYVNVNLLSREKRPFAVYAISCCLDILQHTAR